MRERRLIEEGLWSATGWNPPGRPAPLEDLVLEGDLSVVWAPDRGPRLILDYFTSHQTDVVQAIRAGAGERIRCFGEERFGRVRIVVRRVPAADGEGGRS
jgi:hypothetical protein